VKNGVHKTGSCESIRLSKECPTYGRYQHLRETVSLALLGQRSLLAPEIRKVSRSGFYLPSVYTPGSRILVLRFPEISCCMRQLKIPKIWRRALIVMIPKSLGDSDVSPRFVGRLRAWGGKQF